MALRFFYRNQKIVFGVMVLLMIAFLLPATIKGCGQDDPGKAVIGESGGEEITVGDVQSAAGEIRLLRDYVRFRQGPLSFGLEHHARFGAFLAGCRDNVGLGWILLLREAREMGVRVSEGQVDTFLGQQFGLEGKTYQRLVANLREAKATEKQFRRAVSNYLMIVGAFDASRTAAPPPLEEMRYLFRDLQEEIELAMVVFPAKDYAKYVPNPDSEEVEEMFEYHKGALANHFTNRTPFGFGYKLPHQADVAYLLVDRAAVMRAVEPPESKIADYWEKHRGKLTRTVEEPVPPMPTRPASTAPASRPATRPTTRPATRPATRTREVVITKYSEAFPKIRDILLPEAADAKISNLLQHAKKLITSSSHLEDPYARAAEAMVRKALTRKAKQALVKKAEELREDARDASTDEDRKALIDQANALSIQASRADVVLLEKGVGKLRAGTVKLDDLIEQLAEQSRVKIVFPLGTPGRSLAPDLDVEVEKDWEKLKLGEVLEKITEAMEFDKIEWATCWGFSSTIFPAEPVSLLPVRAGRTGLVDLSALDENDVLGMARLTEDLRSRRLRSTVETAAVFQGPKPRTAPLIAAGGDFRQAMYVSGSVEGRLLWRLVAANRSHSPEKPTSEILEQIVKDYKTKKGYEKALAAAKAMLAGLKSAPMALEKLAQARAREVVKSGPVTRKRANVRTGETGPSIVMEVGVSGDFLAKAFALVPADATKPATDKPADVVELTRQRKVVLIQRIGYRPVTRDEFDKMVIGRTWGRTEMVDVTLPMLLLNRRQERDLATWFVWEGALDGQTVGIGPRVGFERKED